MDNDAKMAIGINLVEASSTARVEHHCHMLFPSFKLLIYLFHPMRHQVVAAQEIKYYEWKRLKSSLSDLGQ
jgi:hypothetical protein